MDWITQSLAVFHKGGPVMYLIAACSLLVAAIGVERYLFYMEAKSNMNGLVEKVRAALEGCDWDTAFAACREAGGAVALVAVAGIQCLQQGCRTVESVLEGEAALKAAQLRQNLNHLDTIVTIAPLLGLLGTVIGMIGSFSIMNLQNGQPLAITGGVGEALIATASGLCVAVFAMIVYSYFSHRLDHMITDMEQICILIVRQAGKGKNHEAA